MYVPNYYNVEDQKLALDFIRQNSFGLLICNGIPAPEITHLPFILEENESGVFFVTHLAKANQQWKSLEKNQDVLLVFTGPHGYISPSWYINKLNVPTWNYSAVHVTGKASIIHDTDEKKAILNHTIAFYEPSYAAHFSVLPDQYKDVMYKEIVGIRIEMKALQAKFKMNQNKPAEDVKGVIENLVKQGNTALAEMVKQFNNSKLGK